MPPITSRILSSALAVIISTAVLPAQDLTADPDQVRLEIGDVRRLAQVLRTVPADDRAATIERQYLTQASPGLRRYATEYKVTGASITAALARDPSAYADLDRTADAVLAQEPALRSALRTLKDLFPDARFPPVWFVVGHLGAGGMVEREGVIIAVERFSGSRSGDARRTPEDVVPIVLHELAHFQSAMVLGVETYLRALSADEGTLLGRALREGSAELVAELTTGRHINPEAERYGQAHEPELWTRFQQDMGRREPGDWMFVRPSNGEWPTDLGYWIGYRIARSYYDRTEDKRRAIRDIFYLTDFPAFLRASGYAERFNK